MAVLFHPSIVLRSVADLRISGAKIYTRLSGTTTPTAAYSDEALTVAHANPIVADANGQMAAIFLDPTINYRLIATDGSDAGNDPSLETQLWLRDGVKVGLNLSYDYTIGASGAVGSNQVYLGIFSVRDFTHPDDFAGSRARLETAPSAETVFDIQVNDITIGTITFANASQTGVFASTGGAVSVDDGDYVDIVAPATTNSAAGLRATFKGTVVT